MVCRSRAATGLERGWKNWSEGGMPGLRQGSLDRHAAVELEKKDGGDVAENLGILRPLL